MANLTLCLTLLFLAGCSAVQEWKNLHLTFGVTDGFFKIPLTLKELLAYDNKYTLMTKDAELKLDFYSYPNDPRVAVGFDPRGNVAAVRYSIPKKDIGSRAAKNGVAYNYTLANKPLYKSGNFWGMDVFHSTALFASPATLAAGGRVANGLAADDVYMAINGKWTLIPKYECNAPKIGFSKGGCFDGMGLHYIQGMSPTMPCEDHQGPFLLYDQGDLVGVGWFPFGTFTSTKDRVWFEDAPSYLTKVFAPNSPPCFEKTAANFGVISFHIFFKANPRLTTICKLGADKSVC